MTRKHVIETVQYGQTNFWKLIADREPLVFVYSDDIRYKIVVSETEKECKAEWTKHFDDSETQTMFHKVEIFYDNNIVLETSCVLVDGGRVYIPAPEYVNNVPSLNFFNERLFYIINVNSSNGMDLNNYLNVGKIKLQRDLEKFPK